MGANNTSEEYKPVDDYLTSKLKDCNPEHVKTKEDLVK